MKQIGWYKSTVNNMKIIKIYLMRRELGDLGKSKVSCIITVYTETEHS